MTYASTKQPTKILLLFLSLLSIIAASTASQATRDIPFLGDSLSPNKSLQERLQVAKELADLETQIEDVNAQWIAGSATAGQAASYRRLIAMPLTEMFDPPMGTFEHGHVQTGDKMSLPKCFWDAVKLNKAEVPWLYEVSRVEGVTSERVVEKTSDATGTVGDGKKKKKKSDRPGDWGAAKPMEPLDSVVGGILDFRAPPNYIFLPWWMMRSLGLKPRDVVDVRQITTVPPGSMVKFRPLKEQTMTDMANPQAVLETELRHYASLTKGATIAFDYNKKRHWFEVAECRSAPRGEKKPMIKVQDCDIASDFLPAKDKMEAKKNKKREAAKDAKK